MVKIGVIGKQTVHGCRAVFYTWAKDIDTDPEPLKRDLISAALCHRPQEEMDAIYIAAPIWKSAAP